jgi:predicted MPP superfamily phosphohydrolase
VSKLISLTATGRGRNYSPLRGLVESALRASYAFGWPGRVWGLLPRAARVQVIEHRLPTPERAPGRPPLRLAFVSDLHIGPTTSPRTLDRAFALLAEAEPDVVVLGGDYVFLDATPPRVRELERRVAALPARTKIAVLGNHDLWTDHPAIERALERAGARVLVNDALRLPPPHDDVAVLGLDDPWTGQPDGDRAVSACGDARVKLAVCHAPDGVPFVRGRGVRLLLCGHTHGGQIALPGPRPIVVPGPLGKRWPFGLHHEDDLTLFVSRGVGTTELPMRAYAPPDVAIFTVG